MSTTTNPRAVLWRTDEKRIARMLNDGKEQARRAIEDAGVLIWNSIQKYDGDPRDELGHPVSCGCTYCSG